MFYQKKNDRKKKSLKKKEKSKAVTAKVIHEDKNNLKKTSHDFKWPVSVAEHLKENPEVKKLVAQLKLGSSKYDKSCHLHFIVDAEGIDIGTVGDVSKNTRYPFAIFYSEVHQCKVLHIYEESNHSFYDEKNKKQYAKRKSEDFNNSEFQKSITVEYPADWKAIAKEEKDKAERFKEEMRRKNLDDGIVYVGGNFFQLSDKQKQAAKISSNKNDSVIVEGPPGTGKTTTAQENIKQVIYELENQKISKNEIHPTVYYLTVTDELAAQVNDDLKKDLNEDLLRHIKVMSYKNLFIEKINNSQQPNVRKIYANQFDFHAWFKLWWQNNGKEGFDFDSEKVYQELLKIKNKEYVINDYSELNGEQQQIVWRIHQSYLDHLNEINKIDLAIFSNQDGFFVDKNNFIDWINKNKNLLKELKHLQSDEELSLLYDEFCNIENTDTYLIKGSLSIFKENERKIITDLFYEYKLYLKQNKKIDLCFQKIPFDNKTPCGLMIFDEAQGASMDQLQSLSIAQKKIINIDPGQALGKQVEHLNIFLKQKLFKSKNINPFVAITPDIIPCHYHHIKLKDNSENTIKNYIKSQIKPTTNLVITVESPNKQNIKNKSDKLTYYYFDKIKNELINLTNLSNDHKNSISNLKEGSAFDLSPYFKKANSSQATAAHIYNVVKNPDKIKPDKIGIMVDQNNIYYTKKEMNGRLVSIPINKITNNQNQNITFKTIVEHFEIEVLKEIKANGNVELDIDFSEDYIILDKVYRNPKDIKQVLQTIDEMENKTIDSKKKVRMDSSEASDGIDGQLDFCFLNENYQAYIERQYEDSLRNKESFVIIVPDNKTKKAVSDLFRNIPVLTLTEARGLEFSNVVSWNCFTKENTKEINNLLSTKEQETDPIKKAIIKKTWSGWRTSWSRAKKKLILAIDKDMLVQRKSLLTPFVNIIEKNKKKNVIFNVQENNQTLQKEYTVNEKQEIFNSQLKDLINAVLTQKEEFAKQLFQGIAQSKIYSVKDIESFLDRKLGTFVQEKNLLLLVNAIEFNDKEEVDRLLNLDSFDINIKSLNGKFPILLAIESLKVMGNEHSLLALLKKSTLDVNIKIGEQTLSQHLTSHIQWNKSESDSKYISTLIHLLKRTDYNAITQLELNDLLIQAVKHASLDLVKVLIIRGANPSFIDKEGNTPLIYACQHNHFDMIKVLVNSLSNTNKKAELINFATSQQQSAIDFLSSESHEIKTYLLQNGAIIKISNIKSEKADSIFSKMNDNLFLACRKMDLALCKLALKNGAEVNAKNKEGKTALQIICELINWKDINNEKNKELMKIIYLLIRNGADIDQYMNAKNETLLMLAARAGFLPLVRKLIDANAKIDLVSKSGQTVFSLACRSNHTIMVLFLLKQANCELLIDKKDNLPSTPIDRVLFNLSKKILNDPNVSFELLEILLFQNAKFDESYFMVTALDLATLKKYQLLGLLIAHNINVNCIMKIDYSDIVRESPLMYAIRRVNPKANDKDNAKSCFRLVAAGANVNYSTTFKNCPSRICTPLFIALTMRNIKLVSFLLSCGARTDQLYSKTVDKEVTILEYAKNQKLLNNKKDPTYDQILNLIISHQDIKTKQSAVFAKHLETVKQEIMNSQELVHSKKNNIMLDFFVSPEKIIRLISMLNNRPEYIKLCNSKILRLSVNKQEKPLTVLKLLGQPDNLLLLKTMLEKARLYNRSLYQAIIKEHDYFKSLVSTNPQAAALIENFKKMDHQLLIDTLLLKALELDNEKGVMTALEKNAKLDLQAASKLSNISPQIWVIVLIDAIKKGDRQIIDFILEREFDIDTVIFDEDCPLSAAIEKEDLNTLQALMNRDANLHVAIRNQTTSPFAIAMIQNNPQVLAIIEPPSMISEIQNKKKNKMFSLFSKGIASSENNEFEEDNYEDNWLEEITIEEIFDNRNCILLKPFSNNGDVIPVLYEFIKDCFIDDEEEYSSQLLDLLLYDSNSDGVCVFGTETLSHLDANNILTKIAKNNDKLIILPICIPVESESKIDNHFIVLLFNNEKKDVYYFDPMGKPIPETLKTLCSHYNLHLFNQENFQKNEELFFKHCGPWVVEFIKSLNVTENVFDITDKAILEVISGFPDVNINEVREMQLDQAKYILIEFGERIESLAEQQNLKVEDIPYLYESKPSNFGLFNHSDPELLIKNNNALLLYLVTREHPNLIEIENLLKNPKTCDVNSLVYNNEYTVLFYAVEQRNVALVRLLLEQGANPDIRCGQEEMTPRQLAAKFDLLNEEENTWTMFGPKKNNFK